MAFGIGRMFGVRSLENFFAIRMQGPQCKIFGGAGASFCRRDFMTAFTFLWGETVLERFESILNLYWCFLFVAQPSLLKLWLKMGYYERLNYFFTNPVCTGR